MRSVTCALVIELQSLPCSTRNRTYVETGVAMDSGNQKTVALLRVTQPAAHNGGENGCSSKGSNGNSGCGSSAGQGDLSPETWEKVKNHPCYSEEAHHHYARM